ncbi:TniQ family protein [[Micrococcus luteus] ATCC 49442]|uniref:TniQ family protein n=1 Tax=[Micrococcus luteus] ATCC 49442 TaxID=2698727 RepID=UPI0013D9AEEF|nr:TniQ family protein [[Micrococcus luteus] ATCC 49442]
MTVDRRWPVHPAPAPGEALSSWLRRIASRYGADLEDLVSELGYCPDGAADLDMCPPDGFARELSGRTGVDVQHIQRMSLSGWSPRLIDQGEPGPDTFNTYTQQFSVLLGVGRRRVREIPNWVAWRPLRPALRACPQCIATAKAPYPYQLLWLLPLTLSCPFHKCLLEIREKPVIYFADWERKPPIPKLACAKVLEMDTKTWQAMAGQFVDLQGRRIHAETWFRLVRTIIDELEATITECGTAARMILGIWKEAGHPARIGPLSWQPHESYSLDIQLRALETTAIAIHLLESGAFTGRGPDASFFLPVPGVPA